ncbi:hypothetical protein D4764_10G0004270 [Takifugu flavidus]|uniref:Uncharacterized protein n=1 Tax=Takifugu flavidus TaxID=433684 RepID=A0A5C6PLX2_9TELE|nr:hypothetical protein D4764_10G0004270 [Takifugu flavidus]
MVQEQLQQKEAPAPVVARKESSHSPASACRKRRRPGKAQKVVCDALEENTKVFDRRDRVQT